MIKKGYKNSSKMEKSTLQDLGMSNESISVFRLRQWLRKVVTECICCPHCRKELEFRFNIK